MNFSKLFFLSLDLRGYSLRPINNCSKLGVNMLEKSAE